MKVYDCYYYQEKAVVCYEFTDKLQSETVLKIMDERKSRQSAFVSNGLYYLCEYITDEVADYLIKNLKFDDTRFTTGECVLIASIMAAYGDWRYYFNRTEKRFIKEWMSIGD